MELQSVGRASSQDYSKISFDPAQLAEGAREASSVDESSWSSFIQKFFTVYSESKSEENRLLPAIPSAPPLPRPKPLATIPLENALRKKPTLSEAEIFMSCLQAFAEQEKLREEAILVSKSLVEHHGKRAASLRDQYNELSQKMEEKAAKSALLGWVSVGAGALSAVCVVGGAAAVFFSQGTALPGVMGLASALSGTTKGVTEIYDSFIRKDLLKHQAASLETKTLRDLNMERIEQVVQHVQEDEQSIVGLWSERGNLLRNMPKN